MGKLAISLALAAVASLAACAYRATPAPTPVVVIPQQPAPAVVAAPTAPAVVVPQPIALRPGIGRVESLSAVQGPVGTSRPAMRRLGIKMDDGTMQYVDVETTNVAIGDRVELTTDGYLRQL
jgi:hypothetical protein